MTIQIEKQAVQWFKCMFSYLKYGGHWLYADGCSAWRKVDDSRIAFVAGDRTNPKNRKTAAHIRAAGFELVGI